MKRNKQTKLQRQRSSGVIRTIRTSEGNWGVIFSNKHGIVKRSYHPMDYKRCLRSYSGSIRNLYLRSKR